MLDGIVGRSYRRLTAPITKKKVGKAARATLETVIETTKHAISAANPIKDIKNTYTAAKNIWNNKPTWEKYKANLKEGKFLGEGNLATLMFNTGIVATGMYVPLLVTRAAIGGGAYLGKEAVSHDATRGKVAGLVDMLSVVPAAAGSMIGVPYQTTRNALSKDKTDKFLRKLKDDQYFKEKVFPIALDAAIGMKGYGTIVGAKYGAKIGGKLAEEIEANTKWNPIKYTAGIVGAGLGIVSNFFGDVLSALVFKQGVQNVQGDVVAACKGEYNDEAVGAVKYVKDGEMVEDVKNYFASHNYLKDASRAATFVGNGVLDFAKNVANKGLDSAKYVFCGDLKDDVVNSYKYTFKGGLEGDVKEGYDYVTSVEPLKDLAAIAGNFGMKVATDVGELVGINPEERYAVVVAGFDWDEKCGIFGTSSRPNPQWFMNETCKAYTDLLEMGFKPENIRVLSPDEAPRDTSYFKATAGYNQFRAALDDGSYNHDATRANVTKTLEDMARKVDGNDVFVMYAGTHGNTNFNGDSYISLDNGNQRMNWKELKKASDGIDAGREIYVVDACHSGDFTGLADETHEESVAASKDSQVAYSDTYGDSFARYFITELKKIGLSRDMPDSAIKSAADIAMNRFKRGNFAARNQIAQYGSGGTVQQVA
jgi:hypothetical protein